MRDRSTVLVPVDFSPYARAAALRACELARACDARVRLVHGIVPRSAPFVAGAGAEGEDDEGSETLPKSPHHALERWRAELELLGAPISAIVEDEDPIDLITRQVREDDVRLVVMGMHGFRGFERTFFGSVADRALRAAQVPILLVKESEYQASLRIHRILLATDFSPASEAALRLAIHWARRLQADVEVLHSIHDAECEPDYPRPRDCASRSSRQRANALESLRSILSRTAAAGVRAVADLTYGTPSIEIVKYAARSRADLLVLGLRGQGDEPSMRWGSVTERVIRHVKCSVLVAPNEPGRARNESGA